MVPDKTNYSKINDIDLKSITIYAQNSKTPIDIKSVVTQFQVFENLFSDSVSGYLQIVDANNLLSKIPIMGREKIIVRFRTPGLEDSSDLIELKLICYKLSKVNISDNGKVMSYSLHFMSEEHFVNETTRLQRSYKGKITTTINRIFNEVFPESSLTIGSSDSKLDFVCPRWKPFSAIRWLANRCISNEPKGMPDMLFYADLVGYHLRSYENMMNQPPVAVYTYYLERTQQSLEQQFYSVDQIDTTEGLDAIQSMKTGTYASRLCVHDITNKSYTEYSFSHKKDVPLKDNEFSPISSSDRLNTSYEEKVFFKPERDDSNSYDDWILKRNSHLGSMEFERLGIVVAGNHTLRPGQTVELNVAQIRTSDESEPNKLDERMSGKFIIAGINHIINADEYICKVKLIRNHRTAPLPDIVTVSGIDEDPESLEFRYF